jgi:hypothetical protein
MRHSNNISNGNKSGGTQRIKFQSIFYFRKVVRFLALKPGPRITPGFTLISKPSCCPRQISISGTIFGTLSGFHSVSSVMNFS